jgi:hypothetical protein
LEALIDPLGIGAGARKSRRQTRRDNGGGIANFAKKVTNGVMNTINQGMDIAGQAA